MKNIGIKILKITASFFYIILVLFFHSCDDMKDFPHPEMDSGPSEPTILYILSEGLFNMNNSTLARYDLNYKTMEPDFFLTANKRGLGDTANDLGIYGSKLYVVVNVSSQVEVLDQATGKSLAQIAFFDEKGLSREPRNIVFGGGKAYVCSFDGTVAKIDTATFEIEDLVKCGKNPDAICLANNKLYVSNSGGLNFPNYENSVSVIDLATFAEIKKITVDINPGKIQTDSEGDVYVLTRGNYGSTSNKLHRINTFTDKLEETFDEIHPLNFSIYNDKAYLYNFDNETLKSEVKVFDCHTDEIISNHFISDGTKIEMPFGIDVNPLNGDVYITDAKSYTVLGDVLCFDSFGKLKFKMQSIGLNPNKVVFGRSSN